MTGGGWPSPFLHPAPPPPKGKKQMPGKSLEQIRLFTYTEGS